LKRPAVQPWHSHRQQWWRKKKHFNNCSKSALIWKNIYGQPETIRNGVADNQNSLTAGPRGPLLMQDYQLLENLAHQNRERIPERTVHAKGTAAYGNSRFNRSKEKTYVNRSQMPFPPRRCHRRHHEPRLVAEPVEARTPAPAFLQVQSHGRGL
jgi:hypothetical protein